MKVRRVMQRTYIFVLFMTFDFSLLSTDMKMYMKNVAKNAKRPLEASERNLFSVAYKNAVGARRASWRIICSLESKSENVKLEIIQEYRKKVEKELRDVCEDALESIDLLLEVVDKEDVGSQAFYHKM